MEVILYRDHMLMTVFGVLQMLNCIIGMVDKTKRALSVLQERSLRDREELSVWMRRHAEGMDQDVKKRTSDMMAYTMRQTEDRVSEVRRRAGTSHTLYLEIYIKPSSSGNVAVRRFGGEYNLLQIVIAEIKFC